MEKNYNEIVISADSFLAYSDDPQTRVKIMWDTVTQLMNLLLALGYICVVYEEEVNLIVIQYEHDEHHNPLGSPNPKWITESDYEKFQDYLERSNAIISAPDNENF